MVGNTEKLAKMISEMTGADLFKIEQKIPYAADYNTCIQQAKEDLQAKARPELVSVPDSLDGYDEIYLGFAGGIIGLNQEKPINQGFALI